MKKAPRVIMFERDLQTSEVFWLMSGNSLKVLLRFYGKRKMESYGKTRRNKRWEITNNGKLVFTYKEAESLGLSRKQFRNAIDDLISKGFLEVTFQGNGPGQPSTYKLLDRWKGYGKKDFKPGSPRRVNTSPDMGWSKFHSIKKQNLGGENGTSSSANIDTSPVKSTDKTGVNNDT